MIPYLLLEIDWEQNLRAMHKRIPPVGTDNYFNRARLAKDLNSRIKEVKKLIVSGEAAYK